ncbi:hypothetical protein COCOBI_08-0430 [Coccomyxa sp. Obi]|nr:hypothetical protein COCOBI_08-0430 [Coccomyxa sp. Obi]
MPQSDQDPSRNRKSFAQLEIEPDLAGDYIAFEAGDIAQMYFTAVTDHVYGAYLVTLEPFPRWTSSYAEQSHSTACGFWALLCGMLHQAAVQGLCLHCAFCGEIERLKPEEKWQVIKVCRGCHLVRYCSLECQAAAWPHHKSVCRKVKLQGELVQPVHPTAGDLLQCLASVGVSGPPN